VCVLCGVIRDWLWVAWKDIRCILKFIEGVDVTSLLFCDQYFVLVKYLHV